MSFNFDRFFDLLIKQLYQRSSNIADNMAFIISECEQILPHTGWQLVGEIDYETDLQILKQEWLQRTMVEKSPDFIIQGIWIGMVTCATEDDEYNDMYFSASTLCNDDDGDMNWIYRLKFFPKAGFANSSALRSIYKIAKDIEDAESGNLGQSVCVAFGFDSGDALFLGRLTPNNFELDVKLVG